MLICLVSGRANKPRTAHFHCSSVTSGMSLKSIFSSGIAARASSSFFCFLVGITSPFRWACFSCRDDPDHFIAIIVLNRVGDDQNCDTVRASEALPAFLAIYVPFRE